MSDLEGLYRQHRAGLVRLVERELHDRGDAEDVVQIAFLDAQRALNRGTIPHNPRAWLAAIALNAARRLRRRRLNVVALEEYAAHEVFQLPEIKVALAGLPKSEQAAVLYREVLGLTYAEIAEQMNTTVPAVTMLLHRARSRLRSLLGSATLIGMGLGRWFRSNVWQATAAKAAGGVVLSGGLATAGFITSGRAIRATSPTAPPVAATQSRGVDSARIWTSIGSVRWEANRAELSSSKGGVHTKQSSTAGTPTAARGPSGSIALTKAQVTENNVASRSPPGILPPRSAPTLRVPTRALPSTTPTIPATTVVVAVPTIPIPTPTPTLALAVNVP